MKKKIKFFVPILVLDILAIISLILSLVSIGGAIAVLKAGSGPKVVGFIFILVGFVICAITSSIFSIISLPFSIISIKKSESKPYPIISTVLCCLIIIASIVLFVVLAINGTKPS